MIERWQANPFPIDFAANNLALRNLGREAAACTLTIRVEADFADVIALALKPNEVARNAADTIVMIVFI